MDPEPAVAALPTPAARTPTQPDVTLRVAGAALAVYFALAVVGYWWISRPERRFDLALDGLALGDRDLVRATIVWLNEQGGHDELARQLDLAYHIRQGDVNGAKALLQKMPRDDRMNAWTFALAGETLYRAGQYEEAHGALAAALAKDPEQVDALRCLVRLHLDLRSPGFALARLEQLTKVAPRDSRPWRMQGQLLLDLGMYKEAEKSLRESIFRNPNPPDQADILIELAECYLQLGEHERALGTLKLCRQPTADAWALGAQCSVSLGRNDEAELILKEILDQNPDHLPSLLLKAQIARAAGDQPLELAVLLVAVKAHPNDEEAARQLAQAYEAAGQQDKAAEQAQANKALEERWQRYRAMEVGADKTAYDAEVRYKLGVLAREMEMPEDARRWLGAVLVLKPGHQQARAAMEELNSQAPRSPPP